MQIRCHFLNLQVGMFGKLESSEGLRFLSIWFHTVGQSNRVHVCTSQTTSQDGTELRTPDSCCVSVELLGLERFSQVEANRFGPEK